MATILDDLDYYELLEAPRGASGSVLRQAYHAASRRFHPDANRGLDPELRAVAERVAKRVAEAYSVLRDPRRRKLYDEQLGRRDGVRRIPLVDSALEAGRRSREEREGRTPQGRRHFALAQAEAEQGDLAAAIRNLQMALTFEPGNPLFSERLAELRARR